MATWMQAGASGLSRKSRQVGTDTAPTLSSDGQGLTGVGGFDLFVICDAGKTFTSIGTLAGYRYDALAGWAPSADLNLSLPSDAIGLAAWAFTGFVVQNPRGAIAHVCTGIGLTGGGLTLIYVCTGLRGYTL
jgi:hypothetical protein